MRGYADREDWKFIRHIYLRTGKDCAGNQNIMLCLVTEKKPVKIDEFAESVCEKFSQISGVILNYNTKDTNVILGDNFEVIRGRDYINDCLCGLNFRISPQSFYQVNHDAAESAYRIIAEKINLLPGERLLDLYCGIGTIGLTVASQTMGYISQVLKLFLKRLKMLNTTLRQTVLLYAARKIFIHARRTGPRVLRLYAEMPIIYRMRGTMR